MSITSQPRWICVEDSNMFRLTDGSEMSFTVDPLEPHEAVAIIDAVRKLPRDYLDLGNAAADLQHRIERLEAQLAHTRLEIDTLRQRAEADESVVPILAADLEKAINMAIRFAFALGVQANKDPHSIYGELQTLAKKYKMNYEPPTEYDYKSMVLPLDDDLSAARLAMADTTEPTQIETDDPYFTYSTRRLPASIDREREALSGEVVEPELTDEELTGIETAKLNPETGRLEKIKRENPDRDWLYIEDDGDPC